MAVNQAACLISITPMLQLAEAGRTGLLSISLADFKQAIDSEDDWTGLADPAARRKKQNRLNTRAWRRRKAIESQSPHTSTCQSRTSTGNIELEIPCWVEDQQVISNFPESVANAFYKTENPLLPYGSTTLNQVKFNIPPVAKIIFPLSSDHLIPLLQFNVLRASIFNRQLVSSLFDAPSSDCSSIALHIVLSPSSTQSVPSSLEPTVLQRTVPHEDWIDIIPHPAWRDNVILAIGTFDEDELWSDTIGGLFEGFPASECEHRGVVAWSPPWHVSGWEISEGFWQKWGWSLKGCNEILEATNKWRRERGEEPLVFEV